MDARALYHRWLYELWPTADRELARRLVTPGFVGHWPDREVSGPDALAAAIEEALSLFTDVTTLIEVGPLVEGDLVAARWAFRGTYRGGLPGVDASAGNPAVLRGADMLRVEDGRFAEYWVSSDAEQLVRQLTA